MTRPVRLPAKDDLRTRGNDKNGAALNVCKTALAATRHLTFRETRNCVLGGLPSPAPQVPYVGIPYLKYYLNHALLPSLIQPEKYQTYFGVNIQVLLAVNVP